MNKLIPVIILALTLNAFSLDERFERMQESAHPTPVDLNEPIKFHKYKIPYKVQEDSKFLNINTIAEEDDPLPTQNESSIAINPTDPLNLIASAVDYRDNSSTWIYVSEDGGKTWVNKNLGKANGWRSSNDPSVMFDKDGTGYLVHGAFPASASGENGVYFHRTTDKGKTWVSHIPVIEHRGELEPDSLFEDKYYIHVDNSDDSPYRGHLYIPWKRVTPGDSATQIVLAKSTDKGDTWLEPVNISNRLSGSSEDTTFGQSFPLTATGPEGEVYTIWNHGIEHGVGFNRSLDGGATWGTPEIIHNYNIFGTTKLLDQGWRHTVKGGVRAEAYPVIKTDITNGPYRGNVYVCWAADSVPNIYFSKSTDKGETWTDPKIVHSETKNDQFWEWMGVDPTTGDIAIMYLDSRNDEDNILVECYVSVSFDGGETWIDRKVSDIQSDLRNNPFQDNVFAGDYSGLDFYDGLIYPSWVDMRHTTDIARRDNDVYSAVVNVKAPSPVDNFDVSLIPEEPKTLNLTWDNIFETTFGRPIEEENYQLELYRNNQLIANLTSEDEEFSDTGLTPFERYDYEIRVMVEGDSSIFRTDFSYPGGAMQPDSGVVVTTAQTAENSFSQPYVGIRLPEVRADKETPLVNLSSLIVYREGEQIMELELEAGSAGQLIDFTIEDNLNGYFNYSFKIISDYEDTSIQEQESELFGVFFGCHGPVIGMGEDEDLTINFDDMDEGYYTNNWVKTERISSSPLNSIALSESEPYSSNQNDTLYLTAIWGVTPTNGSGSHYNLSFQHIAHVNRFDSALVEYSTDLKEWTILKKYESTDYPSWDDDELTAGDWKNEDDITYLDGAPGFLRFRFRSNAFIDDIGWYIDDINLENEITSSVDTEEESDIFVYPNPTSGYLRIESELQIQKVKIFDNKGSLIKVMNLNSSDVLNLSELNTGMYLLEIIKVDNTSEIRKISVIR